MWVQKHWSPGNLSAVPVRAPSPRQCPSPVQDTTPPGWLYLPRMSLLLGYKPVRHWKTPWWSSRERDLVTAVLLHGRFHPSAVYIYISISRIEFPLYLTLHKTLLFLFFSLKMTILPIFTAWFYPSMSFQDGARVCAMHPQSYVLLKVTGERTLSHDDISPWVFAGRIRRQCPRCRSLTGSVPIHPRRGIWPGIRECEEIVWERFINEPSAFWFFSILCLEFTTRKVMGQ